MSVRTFAVAAAVVTLAGCEVNLNSEGIVSRDSKRFTVSGQPDVQVETFDGPIEIHSWDRNEVEVEIEKRAMEQSLVDDMKVVAEQAGNRIVVKVTGPRRSSESHGIQIGVHFGPTARLRVALPKQSQVTAKSEDGSITIEEVAGKITLNTNDGSVRATRVSGDIVVRSGDGSIRMERAEGNIDLETEDGSIGLEAKPSVLRAHTNDGTIRLQVEPDSAMTADWDVQTSDGSVVLTLPSGFNAELDAESRDGAVRGGHPTVRNELKELHERGEDRQERRRSLKTTLGSGGKTLKVRTGDGSIRIES